MELLRILYSLLVLFPVHSAHSHKGSPGLLCTNDFVNSVSCTWTSSWVAAGEDCWIFVEKIIWIQREPKIITQSCKLKQHRNSSAGCSIVFENENEEFSPSEVMPNINVKCNSTLVDSLKDFKLRNNIKMHPPGAPNVSTTVNSTCISWRLGSPVSSYFKSKFEFQVQVKKSNQSWKEARNFTPSKQELKLTDWQRKGHWQVRVRVKPFNRLNSSWSGWSPTTSWEAVTDREENAKGKNKTCIFTSVALTEDCLQAQANIRKLAQKVASLAHLFQGRPCVFQQDEAKPHSAQVERAWAEEKEDLSFDPSPTEHVQPYWWLMVMGLMIGSCLVVVVMLAFYKICRTRALLKVKPVPDPSKYFLTLHSDHEGNLKKWLNPLSLSESVLTAQTCDHISPVELCEDWDLVSYHCLSSSSTNALLHFQNYPSSGSNTSGIPYSSSSLSTFSNMGYFISSSSGTSARSNPSPAYFTYQEHFCNVPNSLSLDPSLCAPLTSCPDYERLKKEPQSPDSGFGIGKEDDREDGRDMDVEKEEVLDEQTSHPLILPLHLPSHMRPPSSPPAPPHPPTLTQMSSDSLHAAVPGTAVSSVSTARLVPGAMSRSSSMPMDPCETGYLTLKELQATFSNKSI
ncbi:interleukin-2 receptor subunit beta [Leuresthes tenuis]|uniref:interleukin-2 receptor subunit beta n=1 Tax=Leuresthes tenuis TaxID=355514 RepID=UPI003B506791